MPYGLLEDEIERIQQVFEVFPVIEQAVLYGSRVKGTYKTGSDIDISLKGEQLDLSSLVQIELQLDDLLLPYFLDISIYNHIENEELKSHIDRKGITIYQR